MPALTDSRSSYLIPIPPPAVSTESQTAPPSGTRRHRTGSAAAFVAGWATDRRLPDVLAGGAIIVSGVLLLHWLSRLTFWRDEWGFLLHRRGWSVGTFLDPAVEHLVAIPILIYKLLLSTAGMDSPVPFQVVAVALFLMSVGLLFVYVRSRVGAWLGLAAILPILFLGPAWDDLLFPYQLAWFGSVACGIAALLCLDRQTRKADIAATVLLIGGLLFSDAGIPFVAGATVAIALSPERRRRAFVPAIPAALWAIWYLGWGHTAHTFISLHNAAKAPSYVLDGLSSSLSVYLGLSQPYGSTAGALDWGRPLLVLMAVLAVWRIYRLRRPPDGLLVTLAVLLCFWSLTALNASIFGLPTVGRYQYVGVVGLALVASELARGARIGRWVTAGILVVAVASALANVTRLKDAAGGLDGIAQQERGGLAALELARNQVNPDLTLTQENSGVDYLGLVDARSYLSAVDAFGSPAYPEAQLAGAPETGQVAFDRVSALALRAGLLPATNVPHTPCLSVDPRTQPVVFKVPSEGVLLTARSPAVHAALHRYSSAFPVLLGTLPRGRQELLRISPDRSPQPWSVQLSGGGPITVCRPSAG